MRELSLSEIGLVSGGMRWRGRRQSDNIEDDRTGYTRTNRFGRDTFDPIAQRKNHGSLLRDVRLPPTNFSIKSKRYP